MRSFKEFRIARQVVPEKRLPYYLNWVSRSRNYYRIRHGEMFEKPQMSTLLKEMARTHEDWQVKQARDAVDLWAWGYIILLSHDRVSPVPQQALSHLYGPAERRLAQRQSAGNGGIPNSMTAQQHNKFCAFTAWRPHPGAVTSPEAMSTIPASLSFPSHPALDRK